MSDKDAEQSQQTKTLHRVLAEYMRRRDAGESIDIESFCAAHPDLADALRSYASGEGLLEAFASNTPQAVVGSDDSRNAETLRPGAARQTDLAPNTMLGRYRIIRRLGEGAMGYVYLAEHTHLGREVALKIPKFTGLEGPDFRQRFTREARAAALLDHPNICRVYDADEINGTPCIAMEFIPGQSLARFVGTAEFNDQRRVVEVLCGIAAGLAHAHQQGILHRDLKPGNVLMKGDSVPCVTDFGLARRVDSGDESHLTHEGDILGTPAYMSPEQIEAKAKGVGTAADIYALGVVLYELLAGRTPFQGAVMSVLAQAMRDRPTPLTKVRPDVDPKLSDLCLRMLEKSPADRPQSMQEVIDLLQHWLKETSPETKAVQAKSKQSSERLAETKSKILDLIKRGQFAAASASLEKLLELKSPEAAEQVAWVREKLAQVKKLPKQLKESMPVLLKMAKESIQRHDYAQAAQLLQEFPPDFRSDEVQRVLDQAIELQDESDLLLADLQECVRKKQFQGIEENLKRLLQLRPGNEFARKLRESLQTYSKVPLKQRVYRYDERGRLLPRSSGSLWDSWLLWGTLCFVAVFGLMSWALVIYLKDGDRTIAVEVDETWLKEQGGQLTLAVDGKNHTLTGPGFEIKVALGERGFTVKNGDTVVHNPQSFTIEKQGRQVLRIDATGMSLMAARTDSTPSIVSESSNTINAPLTPLPAGPTGLVKQLTGHTKQIYDLAVSPRGDAVCSISEDKTIRLWNLDTGKEVWIQNLDATPNTVAFHPSGRHILLATRQLARIYDADTGKALFRLTQEPVAVNRAAWSIDGNQLASAANDGVRIWRFDGTTPPNLIRHISIDLPYSPSGVAFVRNPQHILLSQPSNGGNDPAPFGLRLYDIETGKEVRRYTDPVTSKVIEGGGDDLSVTSGGDVVAFKAIKMPGHSWDPVLFDIESGRIVRHPKSQGAPQFSPTGQYLAVGDEDDIVITDQSDRRVWEMQSKLHNGCRLAFTPDGRYLISGSGWHWDHQANTMKYDSEFPISVWRLPQELWPKIVSKPPAMAGSTPRTALTESPKQGDSWISTTGYELVWCPPGKFRMGSGEAPLPDANETPVDVTLSQGLWVAKREVTQAQWKAVMGTEPWKTFQDHREGANNAASHVTWTESVEFCRKLTETERKSGSIPADWEFRLPTEAEWEYFARAGTTTRYSFGNDGKQLSDHAWWRDNADAKGEKYAHEVGKLKPNPWGLYDIHGNVYEWCQDSFVMLLRGGTDPLVNDPKIDNRVNRGGGWDGRDELAHTSSNRRWTPQNERRNNLGLRVVLGHPLKTPTVSQAGPPPPAESAPAPTRLYVAQHAVDGTRNGRSWRSAYQDLQDALQELRRSKGAVKEVWIADGLYKPNSKGGSRDASYELVGGVAYRGGFKGNETELSQRKSSLWTSKTRLSGDLNGDDKGYFEKREDNSHRILTVVRQSEPTVIELLRMEHATNARAGNGKLTSPDCGAGIYIEDSSVVIKECHFHECHTKGSGGGCYATHSNIDCNVSLFNGNRAEGAGAAFYAVQSQAQSSHFAGCWLQYGHGSMTGGQVQQQGGILMMNYCRFLESKMKVGGVIYLSDVQAEFANCLVYHNHSDGHTPGVIATNKSAVTLAHCTFADNTSKRKSSVDLWVENGSQAVVWNSILYSGDGTTVGKDSKSSLTARYSCLKGASDGLGVISSAPMFVNSGKTDYHLQPNSPCRDSGSNVAIAVTLKSSDAGEKRFISLPTDIDNKPRKVGSAVDLGAYELQQ